MTTPKRILFDLGAYNGDTIDVAITLLGPFDKVYAFEPLARPCAEMKRRFSSAMYHIQHAAGDIEAGQARVYLGHSHGDISSSLHSNNPNCDAKDYEDIQTIDFPEFLKDTCKQFGADCHVTLKMNIEGSEYRILERMLNDGSIDLVNKLYCDWHWYFVDVSEFEHHDLVCRLRKHGHPLCGDKPDELYFASRHSAVFVSWKKFTTFLSRSIKLTIKRRIPLLFRILKKARSIITGHSEAVSQR